MVMKNAAGERITMPDRPKKRVKRIAVSSKRQISIPKDFYEQLGIGSEVVVELYNNQMVIKPVKEEVGDFSSMILKELIEEGYEGDDLLEEFENRKTLIRPAVNMMIEEALERKPVSRTELFGDDEDNDEDI